MSRNFFGCAALAMVLVGVASHRAAAAAIGLNGFVDDQRVIQGGKTYLHAQISNTDTSGDPLDYAVSYLWPDDSTINGPSGSLVAGATIEYQQQFNSFGMTPGAKTLYID